MTEERKAQLAVEVDASGAKAGFAQVKADARDMAQAVAKSGEDAGKGIGSIGDKAAPAAAKVEAATKSFINSIQRTTAAMEAGSKSSSEYYRVLAGQRGIDVNALKPYLEQLDAVSAKQKVATGALVAGGKALNAYGQTAGQVTNALRQVPAQFTDIITSLQGGQKPLTVLIQQGGQLKDVFGGIGPAARALGGYIVGLINPLTIAAGAVAALSYAYFKASEESTAFNRAIILSGNAAGATTGQLRDYAAAISRVVGTQGAAAEALAAFVQSGAVGAQNLQEFARGAVQFERATGQAISKTVEQFKELAKSPLEGSVKLNEQYGYLTLSIYRQIKALEDQGRATEAANLAQKSFGEFQESSAVRIVASLGTIERGWVRVKDVIKGAGDALLSIGRVDGTEQKLALVAAQIAKARQTFDASNFGGNAEARAKLEANLELEKSLRRQLEIEQGNAQAQAASVAQVKARAAFDKDGEQFLTKREKLEKEILKTKNEGLAAGASQLEIEKRIAAVRDKYKESGAAGTGQSEVADIKAKIAAADEYIARLKDQAVVAKQLNEGEQLALRLRSQLASTDIKGEARKQKEIALALAETLAVRLKEGDAINRQREEQEKLANVLNDQIDAANKSAAAIEDQARGQEEANSAFGKSKTAIEQTTLAQIKLNLAEADSSDTFAPAYVEALRRKAEAQERYVIALQKSEYQQRSASLDEAGRVAREETASLELQVSLMGRSQIEREKIIAQRKVEVALAKELAEIEKLNLGTGPTADAEREDLRAKARANAIVETDNATQKVVLDNWEKTNEQIASSFIDNLMRGGKSVAQYLKDLFRTLVLRPILQPIGNAVASTITSALGLAPGVAAAGTGSSLLGAGGLLGDVVGAGSLFGQAASATIQNGLISGFSTNVANIGTLLQGGEFAGALGAALPYLGPLALGVTLLSSLLNGKGETRSGGKYEANSSGAIKLIDTPSGGAIGDAGVRAAITATVATINSTLTALGSNSKIDILIGLLESSKDGKGFASAGGYLTTGQTFGQLYEGINNRRGNLTPEEATKAFQEELQQATLQAIQAATDIPEAVAKQLRGVDIDSITNEARAAILSSINTTIVSVQQFGKAVQLLPFDNLKGLAFDAASALIEANGGIEQLTSNLSSYYENFLTAEEKRQNVGRNITNTLQAAGIDVSQSQVLAATRDQFRALFETFEPGSAGYNALLSVNAAFASITPVAEAASAAVTDIAEVADTLEQAIDKLRNPIRTIDDIAKSIVDLGKTGDQLRVQLLAAQGDAPGAKVLQRALDTAGFTDAEVALYDYNQAISDQIDVLKAATAETDRIAASVKNLQTQGANLQVEFFRAQGNDRAANALQRALDTVNFSDAEIAAYDFNVTLQSQIDKYKELKASQSSWYDNFTSNEQKRRDIATNIANTVNGSGLGLNVSVDQILSGTREQVAEYMRQFVAMGAAGQPFVDLLLSLGDAFASITDPIGQVGDAVTTVVETLDQALARLRNPVRTVQDIAQSIVNFEGQRSGLQVQLLTAQGNTSGAQALQRTIDIAGLTDAEVALYDFNQGIRDTITSLNAAAAAQQAYDAATKGLTDNTKALQVQLLTAQGNEGGAQALQRSIDIAGLDAAQIAIYDYNQSLRDQITALNAAAQIASQRASLEIQLAQAQGNTDRVRELTLAATDPALQDLTLAIWNAQDAADQAAKAEQKRQQVQSERLGLQDRILQLEGNTDAIRKAELAKLDPSNRALQLRIYLLEDEAAAAAKAAQVAQERTGLMRTLYGLQGDTAAIRALELAALDPANRALQEQIYALQDQQTAAQDAARAAQELKDSWQNLTDGILGEVARIRGVVGGSGPDTLARRQAEFAILNAQARAGSQDAARALPGASQALDDLQRQNSATSFEYRRALAARAATLEQTAGSLSGQYGLTTTITSPQLDTVIAQQAAQGQVQQAQGESIAAMLLTMRQLMQQWDGEGLLTRTA